jgi:hypothetical protein
MTGIAQRGGGDDVVLAVVRALRTHLVLDQSTAGVVAVGPGGADGGEETAGVGGVAVALHCRSFDVSDHGCSPQSLSSIPLTIVATMAGSRVFRRSISGHSVSCATGDATGVACRNDCL